MNPRKKATENLESYLRISDVRPDLVTNKKALVPVKVNILDGEYGDQTTQAHLLKRLFQHYGIEANVYRTSQTTAEDLGDRTTFRISTKAAVRLYPYVVSTIMPGKLDDTKYLIRKLEKEGIFVEEYRTPEQKLEEIRERTEAINSGKLNFAFQNGWTRKIMMLIESIELDQPGWIAEHQLIEELINSTTEHSMLNKKLKQTDYQQKEDGPETDHVETERRLYAKFHLEGGSTAEVYTLTHNKLKTYQPVFENINLEPQHTVNQAFKLIEQMHNFNIQLAA